MKLKICFLLLIELCLNMSAQSQRNSGVFYSTLFAKEGVYLRNGNFGNNADYLFFEDVNGDGMCDGVACLSSGNGGMVQVSLSDGTFLMSPAKWADLDISDFWKVYMGDINGDKRSDLVCVDLRTSGVWVMLSDGAKFLLPELFGTLGGIAQADFVKIGDIDKDGKDDLLWGCRKDERLNLYTSCSLGDGFGQVSSLEAPALYKEVLSGDVDNDGYPEIVGIMKETIDVLSFKGNRLSMLKSFPNAFDVNEDRYFLYDIDGNKYSDLVVWETGRNCDWHVDYSLMSDESKFEKWINCHLAGKAKNVVNYPDCAFCGSIDGVRSMAMVVSDGCWTGVQFSSREKVERPEYLDNYVSSGNDYVPVGGTYDPGNPFVVDRQIKMIHDAGFTYITMDITNGVHHWVDWRAKVVMDRVRVWNEQLKPGQHKMFVNVALGVTRGKKKFESFVDKFSDECKRAWEEFYIPYKDIYYKLNGKPLFIHMIDEIGWEMVKKLDSYKGDRKYIDRLTNRWMDGTQGGTKGKPNSYGWIVPGNDGNEYHREMMPVMPGFWNGITFWGRNDGMQYKNQWLRVIKHCPESVWVNSFNETWEHTSVEPSRMILGNSVAHIGLKSWTDAYGNLYDNYYWDLTVQYNRLYMDNVLFEGTYFQEEGSDIIYRVVTGGFISCFGSPVMKPVLLLPDGFRKKFNGEILK